MIKTSRRGCWPVKIMKQYNSYD